MERSPIEQYSNGDGVSTVGYGDGLCTGPFRYAHGFAGDNTVVMELSFTWLQSYYEDWR